jgi:hypothetical protein
MCRIDTRIRNILPQRFVGLWTLPLKNVTKFLHLAYLFKLIQTLVKEETATQSNNLSINPCLSKVFLREGTNFPSSLGTHTNLFIASFYPFPSLLIRNYLFRIGGVSSQRAKKENR